MRLQSFLFNIAISIMFGPLLHFKTEDVIQVDNEYMFFFSFLICYNFVCSLYGFLLLILYKNDYFHDPCISYTCAGLFSTVPAD